MIITQQELENKYKNIISVDYGDLIFLLFNYEPKYYKCAGYGFLAKYYIIRNYEYGDIVICTGEDIIKPTLKVSKELLKKYEEQAKDIVYDFTYYKQFSKPMTLYKLLHNFIDEVIQNNK